MKLGLKGYLPFVISRRIRLELSFFKNMALGRLLEGFITILIGVNLIPSVADQVVAAQSGNVTGSASTILGLVTLFFALGIMIAGVNIAVGGLQDVGLI